SPLAVAQSAIRYRGEPLTLLWAVCGGAAIAFAAMWITLRGLTRRSARELLSGEAGGGLSAGPRAAARWTWTAAGVASVVAAGAIVALTAGKHRPAVGAFFAAGALLLVAGIAFFGAILGRAARAGGRRMTLGRLAVRNTGRRRGRSLTVAGLLACGSFLVISVGAFRLGPPGDPYRRQSGTGGFALFGVSALPVFRDLNTPPGRKAYALEPADMEGVRVVAMRARDGDDASCLNLNRAQRPQLLGVPVEELRSRGAFTFARTDPAIDSEHPWGLLDTQLG
ncbi:unnamed protein product, partial [marine sediment metagenome]